MSQKRKENETLRSELSEAVSKLRDREAWWVEGMSSLKLHEEAEKENRSQLEKSAEAEWASAIQLLESRTEAAWRTVSQYEAGFEEQKMAASQFESRAAMMIESSRNEAEAVARKNASLLQEVSELSGGQPPTEK